MDHQRLIKRFFKSMRIGTIFSIAFLAGFVIVATVFAEGWDALPKPDKAVFGDLPMMGDSPAREVASIVKRVIFYIGILAVIALTWGGFLFITAFGEDEKVKKAKSIVQYSLIGVILSISAYSIVDLVNKLQI